MLRQVLPASIDPEIIALDAALRRGDLLFVRQHLFDLASGASNRDLFLRAALYDFLVNDYHSAQEKCTALADDPGFLHPYVQFLEALIAVDLKQPDKATPLLEALAGQWVNRFPESQYITIAKAALALYISRFQEADALLGRIDMGAGDRKSAWLGYQTQRLMGVLAHQLTNYSSAKHLLEEARAGFVALDDSYEVAKCDNALASAYRRLADFSPAIRSAENAVAYFQQQEAVVPMARCRNALGGIQLYFNQQELALQSYEFALTHFRSANLSEDAAWALHNIGLIYRQLGHYRPALQAYAEGREIISSTSTAYLDAYLARGQADLYWHLGETNKAITMLQDASAKFLQLGATTHAANAWRMLAGYFIQLDRLNQAEALLKKSSKLFLQHQRPGQAAITSLALASIDQERGHQESAVALLETASDILIQHHLAYHAAKALTMLAEIRFAQGAYADAAAAISQALDLLPPEQSEFHWRMQYVQAQLALKEGDRTEAQQYLQRALAHLWRLRREALSPAAAATLAKKALPVSILATAIALQQGDFRAALAILEEHKAIQLLERMRISPADDPASRADGDAPPARAAAKLQQLRKAIHIVRNDQNWERLSQLEADFEDLLQESDALNTPYEMLLKHSTLDLERLRSELDKRYGPQKWGCFVMGLFGEDATRLHRFWLDSTHILAAPRDLNAVDQHLLQLASHSEPSYRQNLLDGRRDGAPSDLWKRLETIILPETFAPLMAKVDTLYFAPPARLATFPFAALQLDGKALGLQKNLSQTPSLPVLQTQLQRSAASESEGFPSLRTLKGLVCAVSHHAQMPDLEHTGQEADRLFHALSHDSMLLLDEASSQQKLQAVLQSQDGRTFDLLHFATHAKFHPDHALLSHILLYDDALYVSDILGWRLSARLVTLAACDTAVGHNWAGDEQMGLPHALLIAGAESVLATLWPTDDLASATFLQIFYRRLQTGAASVAAALREARMIYSQEQSSPYEWGSFTLIGLA